MLPTAIVFLLSLMPVSAEQSSAIGQNVCRAQCLRTLGSTVLIRPRVGVPYSRYSCSHDCSLCSSACTDCSLCSSLQTEAQLACKKGCQQWNNNGSSPIQSNGSSPIQSNGSSPIQSNGSSPIQSNGSSPIQSNGSSPIQSNVSSPIHSLDLLCLNVYDAGSLRLLNASFLITLSDPRMYSKAIVYHFEIRNRIVTTDGHTVTAWQYIGNSERRTLKVTGMLATVDAYQLRVVAVTAEGPRGRYVESKWLRMQAVTRSVKPTPVASIDITNQYMQDAKISAELRWKTNSPLGVTSCWFEIFYARVDDRHIQRESGTTFHLDESAAYRLDGLAFSTNYSVFLTSLSHRDHPRLEARSHGTVFRTQSCLMASAANYSLCPPEAVVNLTATRDADGLRGSWDAQNSNSEFLLGYRVDVAAMLLSDVDTPSLCMDLANSSFALDRNTTTFLIEDLSSRCSFEVTVTAMSLAGSSHPRRVSVLPSNPLDTAVHPSPYWLLLLILVGGIVALTGVLYARFKHIPKRHHVPIKIERSALRSTLKRNSVYETYMQATAAQFATQSKSIENSSGEACSLLDRMNDFYSQIKLGKKIGEGAFGVVYEAAYQNRFTVAVKMLPDIPSKEAMRSLRCEIELMSHIQPHPNVISHIAFFETPLALVMEFCDLGDLKSYLKNLRLQIISCSEICQSNDSVNDQAQHSTVNVTRLCLDYGRQIAAAMEHLSAQGLVHRDLAARNVLVFQPPSPSSAKILKVTDFGLTRAMASDTGMYLQSTRAGLPVKWMSPEASILHEFTEKSDVWSFGVVLWEIGTLGGAPFATQSNEAVLCLLANDEARLAQPPNVSDNIYAVMEACWASEPSHRPAFSVLKESICRLLQTQAGYITPIDLPPCADYYNDDIVEDVQSTE